MAKVVVTLRALIVGAGLALSAACAGVNAQTNSFNTLDDARQAGAVERGLLPGGLPAGARDIRIAHVPGTSRRWGLFDFPPAESPALKRILAGEVSLAGQYLDVPGRIEWWPVALRGEIDAERVSVTGLRAYRTSTDSFIVAVNWNQGRAYFWSAR